MVQAHPTLEHKSILDPEQVGWFAARQPAIIRLLTSRLGEGTDAQAVGLDGSWRLASVFELRDGVAPPRLSDRDLDDGALALARDALSEQALADGAASRQPQLCRWVAAFAADPPVPLTVEESTIVAELLVTVLYAFDGCVAGDTAMSPLG